MVMQGELQDEAANDRLHVESAASLCWSGPSCSHSGCLRSRLPGSARRPTSSSKRPSDPLFLTPAPVGVVQPPWLPYMTPPPTRGSPVCSVGGSSGQFQQRSGRRRRLTDWSTRHHVSQSKDNKRLPKLQRVYFDDMPRTRCQGGSYHVVPGHRAQNFDHFQQAPTFEQRQNVLTRWTTYPFVEKSGGLDGTSSSSNISLVHAAAAGYTNSMEIPVLSPTSSAASNGPTAQAVLEDPLAKKMESRPVLYWNQHLRANRGNVRTSTENDSSQRGPERLFARRHATMPEDLVIPIVQPKMFNYEELTTKSFKEFSQWCTSNFDSYVRLWRVLDTNNTTRLTQNQFCRGLHDLGFSGDARELFRVMNRDQTGTLLFYHFAPEAALAIAELLHYARTHYGSVRDMGLFTATAELNAKVTKAQFVKAFKRKGFTRDDAIRYAWELVDRDGDGSVTCGEALVLDKWEFPEWLVGDVDEEAAEYFKKKLLEQTHGNSIAAWRRYLDRDGSMRVPWYDFRTACRRLLAKTGEASASLSSLMVSAWRSLDRDLSGWISLHEFDEEAYDIIVKFCRFARKECGSVYGLLKAMSGIDCGEKQVAFQEFRKGLKTSGLPDATILRIYKGLDIDGNGGISAAEVQFLDKWDIENENKEEDAWAKASGFVLGDDRDGSMPASPRTARMTVQEDDM
eukprot:TRINITY_DN5743_c0_g1_i1.p1 TRINITY_DN5743_c0_g1~~TRINITY_DN5743_c0_g1_i1.p1  ORF type:complete len:681 (-),score=103.67 TRINITY_DN5743_c0_g1_i1:400-2442(-)